MATENSALVALAEIHELESRRIANEQARRDAEREAQARAQRDAVERTEAEARRVAELQAMQAAQAAALQAEREREERIRIAQAEVIARAEHEARVRAEELRLAAQLKLAERQARPRWPLFAAPVLIAAVIGAGMLAWRGNAEADARADELAAQREAHEARIAAIADRVSALQSEQDRLEADRAVLEQKLADAADAEEKAKLERELADLRAKLSAGEAKGAKTTKTTRTTKTTPRTQPRDEGTPDVQGRPPRERIETGDEDDPLGGLTK
ncbi:MAG TPA: hypothetical protein VG755_03480 [Nannocystaceae bacterium]|nr:hypothetical protein [Nannocystaceae bacterium]